MDYLVVLAWLGLVLLLVGLPTLLGWVDLSRTWSRAWAVDVAVGVLTVLPFLGYPVGTEAGPHRATWGKRHAGLALGLAADSSAPAASRVLLRTLVKVLPWQLGHMSALRFAEGTQSVPLNAVGLYGASTAVLLGVALPPLLDRPGLHDLLTGTRVGVVRPPRPASPVAPS